MSEEGQVVNLLQLETFVAVARTESFTKTASLVCRTQSAVSRQIQDLERTLGVLLFERIGRKVSLTEAGRILFDQAPRLLQQAKDLKERLRDLSQGVGGELRIGGTISAASTFLPQILAKFRRTHPSVKLSLQPGHTQVLIEKLRSNDLDAAVLGREVKEPDLKTCSLISDEIVLIAASDNPLARKQAVEPHELNGMEFMFRESGSDSRDVIKQWFDKHGVEVKTFMELW
ncbi:MAG: LysR family transcriptional regulator [Desulfomonile tiedjei]|uniref:LysR family transcriptional regulator n=1 Tax=Desulfomonile tiedjei TaxID=2358 RepID=A0A9D6Z357_9BACT|nr:LysR family transcriptional regulator [Desulfomonile tiedjei]